METEAIIKLVRENERMKVALQSVRALAEESVFGGWRFKVAALVDRGLNQ